ncbi:hypothetical protein D9756_011527 [Leucocoprinus leucothites]|uniref:Uncharacterized protein n=1 Tax=Leucocoprinus leucothites TaxID=201217 RepID=A0A8H5CML8_9AGAR|nr:hypothetical protein D9756_011527 [Leucoagaricus leucothites]
MDDSSHNSTLSNRIAAPNPLDLMLEHLDIVTENESKAGVEDVKVCGAKWHKPDPVHTPKEKTRVSTDGRQIVVDELSKLPPVRLILPEQAALVKSEKEALLPVHLITPITHHTSEFPSAPAPALETTSPAPAAPSSSIVSLTHTHTRHHI